MPRAKPNSSASGNLLAAILSLTIAGALVLLFTLNSKQNPRLAVSETPNPGSQIPPIPPASSGISNLNSEIPTRLATLLHDWKETDDPGRYEIRAAELASLLQNENLADILRALPPELLNFALGLPAFQAWIVDDPASALALFATRAEISESHTRIALATWFAKDYDACTRHLHNLPAGPWREQTLALATQLTLTNSPPAAAAWAALLEPGPRQTSLYAQIAVTWFARDDEEALHWVAQTRDDALRERLYAALVVARAGTDPEQAVRWLLQAVRPGALREQTTADIAAAWAATDPALVSAWIEKFPYGEPRQTATRALVNLWAAQDRPAAAAWIACLPPGPDRDDAQSHLDSLPMLTAAR